MPAAAQAGNAETGGCIKGKSAWSQRAPATLTIMIEQCPSAAMGTFHKPCSTFVRHQLNADSQWMRCPFEARLAPFVA
jgi:hypothetical protein